MIKEYNLSLLKALNASADPYIDVRDLAPDFSFNTIEFGVAFRSLFDEGLINSKHDYGGCGWSDGYPLWSIIDDLHVTPLGLLKLKPSKTLLTKRLSDFIKHPLVTGIILIILTLIITKMYSDYTKDSTPTKEKTSDVQLKTLESPKPPPRKEIPVENTKNTDKTPPKKVV